MLIDQAGKNQILTERSDTMKNFKEMTEKEMIKINGGMSVLQKLYAWSVKLFGYKR